MNDALLFKFRKNLLYNPIVKTIKGVILMTYQSETGRRWSGHMKPKDLKDFPKDQQRLIVRTLLKNLQESSPQSSEEILRLCDKEKEFEED